MNKTIIGALVAILIVGGGSFYAGMSYAKGQPAAGAAGRGQFGAGAAGFAGRAGRGGFSMGQIVTSSNGSITVKLQSGSTQIVLLGTSTQILKSTVGSASDLTQGTNVLVTGSSNSDGSLTAQSIQIRPAGMTGVFGAGRAAGQ